MLATIATFGATRLLLTWLVRPHLQPLVHASRDLLQDARTGDWIVTAHTVDGQGHVLGGGWSLDVSKLTCPGVRAAPGRLPDRSAVEACLRDQGVHVSTRLQPAGRFWTFQWLEAGLYIMLACAALAVAVWWVQRDHFTHA